MFARNFVVVAALAIVFFDSCQAVSFDMNKVGHKCLQEDVQKDVLVVGTFEISHDNPLYVIDLEITDSKKHRVYHKEGALNGKFAFTSDDYDTFDICFNRRSVDPNNQPPGDSHVSLDVKLGVEAKSYEQVAEAEHLSAMEVELRRLEDMADSIVRDFGMMKKREELHRDTNESTNERMLYFSIFSMLCLLGLAVWQVLYLKRYFKQKKLI
eukprot:m.12097 g.12097  ORF g.12097 m.12097 type:complete len:211 (-) comp4584_c0_seq2:1120-1752(-)